MIHRGIARCGSTTFLCVLVAAAAVAPAFGQDGVLVDPEGVLRLRRWEDRDGALHRARVEAARAALDRDLAAPAKFRKVSLTRLQSLIGAALDKGGGPTDAMRHLAGLTGVRYVFFYPESGDVVLAGPAEGWVADAAGRVVGIHSGRPVLELQDLIVALRTYALVPGPGPVISVSIEPTREGLLAMQRFLAGLRNIRPSDDRRIAAGLKDSLGRHRVLVRGISADTHFAQVLVEADYRMKLIGIGLEKPPVAISTYIAKANPRAVAANALKRWYFVPDYQCVRLSHDGLAMELVGQGVKLVGADEVVGADGVRRAGGPADRASQVFCRSFTEKYPALAARSPVYAQLRNLIDLAIVAAHLREQGIIEAAGWRMDVFGDESRYAVETWPAPGQVESAVNVVWRGNTLMTPIGGGVRIEAHQALSEANLRTDKLDEVRAARAAIDPATLPADRWWWD